MLGGMRRARFRAVKDASRKRGANNMATTAIEHYLYLLDAGFEGPDWSSLLSNLRTLTPEDWLWVPPGGARSIRSIVHHAGGVKFMAHNQAFGDGTLTEDDPLLDEEQATADIPSAIAWLRMGHARLRGGIAALTDDAELTRP